MYLVSFIIGLIIVISAILLIRSELNRAVRSQAMLLQQSRVYKDADLFDLLDSLQSSVDEMNRAFYDIAGDLEGKYSIHEKEIQMLNEKAEIHLSKLTQHDKKLMSLDQTNSGQVKSVTSKSTKENIEHMNINQTMTLDRRGQSSNHDSETLTKVIELRSQGKSLPQIAKELGIGMGELQLLISLKK